MFNLVFRFQNSLPLAWRYLALTIESFFFPPAFQTNQEDSFDYFFLIFHIKCLIFESEKPTFSYLGIGMTMEFGPEYFCD
jgi:hypothetical protein